MNITAINWDDIPEVITKDQLYQICHISKSTALYLLRSGKIPCEYSGKKTRCYKIKKADVIAYLQERKVFPECFSAPAGWYKGNYSVRMENEVPKPVLDEMRIYYSELFINCPDVLTSTAVSNIIGYGTTAINNWCAKNYIKAFKKNGINHIPKMYLVEFCCSKHFRAITRKSSWHICVLREFPRWQQIRDMQMKGAKNNG